VNNRTTVRLIVGTTMMGPFALLRALIGIIVAIASKPCGRSERGAR
jgi:hypothetical protein